MLKSYPKILALVGKYFDFVKGQRVEVTEKIDGSQFAFGKDLDGNLYMRSKGASLYPDGQVQDLFRPAVNHVLSVQHKIPDGMAFYGETLKTPRHNTLAYNRVPTNHIMLFGVTDFDRTEGDDHEEISYWAEQFEIEPIPLIGHFTLTEANEALRFLDKGSALGGCNAEGVVIKDYTRPLEFSGMVYPFTALKLVTEAFKEKHKSNPDWTPSKSKLETLLESYRTEARWMKAVQHLRDAGELLGEPKDIGALLKEVNVDLIAEEKENFKEELYQIYQKEWKSSATRGFPEWYKNDYLLR